VTPSRAAEPAREPEATPQATAASPVPVALGAAAQVLQLQRTAGNRAVGQMIARNGPAPAPAADPTASAEPFELGGYVIGSYETAAAVLRVWCITLDEESKALGEGGVAVPEALAATRKSGLEYVDLLQGGGIEALDQGNAEDLREWYGEYVTAINAGRAAQATEAAARAKTAAAELQSLIDQLDALTPALREVQRSKFRGGDEDGLLETADAVAGVLDTALVTKDAIEKTLDVAEQLRFMAATAKSSKTAIDVASKVRTTLGVLEQINKAWATFQLARAAIDVVSGGKTDAEGGRKAVGAMATTVSAGGTLLGASVGFTLYSNLYIGPMTSACLAMLAKIEDMISKSTNRAWIELGRFEYVNWSLEPGGRPMFDWMLKLMRAGDSSGVPTPTGAVEAYLVKYSDEFSAGAGKKGGELPTEGVLFWEETDKSKIKFWAIKNRDSLWGMLYGAAKLPPAGGPAL
jgi:hypothetical protein